MAYISIGDGSCWGGIYIINDVAVECLPSFSLALIIIYRYLFSLLLFIILIIIIQLLVL